MPVVSADHAKPVPLESTAQQSTAVAKTDADVSPDVPSSLTPVNESVPEVGMPNSTEAAFKLVGSRSRLSNHAELFECTH